VPLGNVLAAASGSWHTVFIAAAVMNALAAIMALAVLKPLRASHAASASSGQEAARPA
jgi:MFS transporter, OFA family, oxalate/formate antiporter